MKTGIIVAGGRDFEDYARLSGLLDIVTATCRNPVIISGDAKGADALGERYAGENDIPLKVMPADWTLHGRAAGPIRNRKMAEYAASFGKGILVAFWNGSSRGTKNMLDEAARHGLDVIIERY